MARPRVAVDAPVLAAAVRIDGAVEGDVRRGVVADDPAARVRRECRAELRRRQIIVTPVVILAMILTVILSVVPIVLPAVSPPVVEVFSGDPLEPAGGVAERASPFVNGDSVARRHGLCLMHVRCRCAGRPLRWMRNSVIHRSVVAGNADQHLGTSRRRIAASAGSGSSCTIYRAKTLVSKPIIACGPPPSRWLRLSARC